MVFNDVLGISIFFSYDDLVWAIDVVGFEYIQLSGAFFGWRCLEHVFRPFVLSPPNPNSLPNPAINRCTEP